MKIDKIEALLRPIVRVTSDENVGSGVLVYSEDGLTLVLTNAHILNLPKEEEYDLDDTPFVSVDRFKYDDNGRSIGFYRVAGRIVAYDEKNDLAVIKLRDKSFEPNTIQWPNDKFISKLKVFDDLYVVGCPLGENPLPTRGMLTSLNVEFSNREYWMTSAPVVTGNSGGGCFKLDKKTNKFILVGIPTAMIAVGDAEDHMIPHLNYIVPPHRVKKFITYVLEQLLPQKDDIVDD